MNPEQNETAAPVVAPVSNEEIQAMREKQWNTVVTTIIRKSKGLKDEAEVTLPTGETGRYIKYALDNQGRLSLGARRGRIKPRPNQTVSLVTNLAQRLFPKLLHEMIGEMLKTRKEEDKDKPMQFSDELVQLVASRAGLQAKKFYSSKQKRESKAIRLRQKISRRINAGSVRPSYFEGNRDRRSHAAA